MSASEWHAMQEELTDLRRKLAAMHRRAQRAEALAHSYGWRIVYERAAAYHRGHVLAVMPKIRACRTPREALAGLCQGKWPEGWETRGHVMKMTKEAGQ